MRAHNTAKVQPLTLDSLLEMRKQLEDQLKMTPAESDRLHDLHDRCERSISNAIVEMRISAAKSPVAEA